MKRRGIFITVRFRAVIAAALVVVVIAIMYTPAFWKAVYPIYFYPLIQRQAMAAHINPLLVAAVVRVESHFREDDVSHAGAIGLMQLMPETARWIARQTGQPPYTAAELSQPEVNLRLGSWYVSYLLRQFNGNLPEAIAAYNAGPNRVQRWLRQNKWSGDEVSVEDIPVRETRHFVERVLYTYGIFQRFY